MSIVDLTARLKEHVGCTHSLEATISRPARLVTLRHIQKSHGKEQREVVKIPVLGEDAHGGSAVFHDAARFLVELGHDGRAPLTISDEEYAGFVAKGA